MRYIDITNHTYGRLTVISRFDSTKWVCLCSCGKYINADKNNLRSGHTKSCGCLEKDHNFGICGDGLRNHPMYQTWKTMIYRCTKPHRKEFKNYGGRGISVSERWFILDNFISDMYPSYIKGYQLDRIDNNGNYEQSNCMWIPPIENKRKTRRIKLSKDIANIILKSNKTNKELATIYNCSEDAIRAVRKSYSWI